MISVIIPVYNVEKYLKRCLDSVINQTYRELEIILVNDGSTDGSREICIQYANEDSRIKFIEEENQGLSAARNLGIENATGEYITFVDSDDFIDCEMLKILFQCIQDYCADVAICDFLKVYEEGQIKRKQHNERIVHEIFPEEFLYYINRKHPVIVNAWDKLYKKEIFSGVRFPKGKLHEDEFVLYDWLFQCKKIIYIKKKLYYYFQRMNGIMGNYQAKNAQHIMEAWNDLIDFAIRNKDDDLYQISLARKMCIAAVSYKRLHSVAEVEAAKRIYDIFQRLYKKKELRRFLSTEERVGYLLLDHFPKFYIRVVNLYRRLRK